MLESLTIRNFAIIDEITVEFSDGLNVITGETGAGKSIVLDALELVLGARSSAEMIRSGAESLSVSGVFTADATVMDGEFPVEAEDGLLILRRDIRADGAGRCYVNDRPVTLRALKALGDRLVDLHGQHDHQSLLAVHEHIRFLDGFGKLVPLAREVADRYGEYTGILESIETLRERIAAGNRDRELHRFQIAEIGDAGLKPGEDGELEQDILRLSRASDLKSLGLQAFEELSEADGSIAERLGNLSGRIGDLSRYDDRLAPLLAEIEAVIDSLGELAREFRGYGERLDDDPALLAEMETRLALIDKLKKKYGPSLEDVLGYYRKISMETEVAENAGLELENLEANAVRVRSDLLERAALLSRKREEIAPLLAREVESHLVELGMSGARLVVDIAPCESGYTVEMDGGPVTIGRNGLDRVEFLISANPGEPSRPLVKVASGGEISRIMLSLKLALNGVDSVPTMVFDEIDTGVSGRVADAVGRKLRRLAEARQMVVITHLPQIAAMGDRHFSARKRVEGDRASTRLLALDPAMREEELALMISGDALTETALAHAREMIRRQRTETKEK